MSWASSGNPALVTSFFTENLLANDHESYILNAAKMAGCFPVGVRFYLTVAGTSSML